MSGCANQVTSMQQTAAISLLLQITHWHSQFRVGICTTNFDGSVSPSQQPTMRIYPQRPQVLQNYNEQAK